MSEQDRLRRLVDDYIDRNMPNIADLMDDINIGISFERSFAYMMENAKEFYEAFRSDVADVQQNGDSQRSRAVGVHKPRASSDVCALASELTKRIESYYESTAMLLDTEPKKILPGDYKAIHSFRNYAEHSGGGTDIPLFYIPSDKKTATVWDLGLDLEAILRYVSRLPRSRKAQKDYLDELLGLPQNKGGTLNLSESIDVAIMEALKHHVQHSSKRNMEMNETITVLEGVLEAAVEDEEYVLVDIIELYIEREELRQSLAEDARKLTESFPEIRIRERKN